jgi:polysaccharide pyruvyl transferase WcaK-like protein
MRILYLGTHGPFNIADDLLLETFLLQLGREHDYAVTSNHPRVTENYLRSLFKAQAIHAGRDMFRFLWHLITSDLVFFGSGNSLTDRHPRAARRSYANLLNCLLTVTFAKSILRKKVIMSNIDIGPLASRLGRFLARLILNQVDLLSVRDERSHRIALGLGLSASKVNLVPDALFVHSPDNLIDDLKPFPPTDKTRIALNLIRDIENPRAWEDFLANLAAALVEVNAAAPLEIHALPMQSGPNDDLSVLMEFSLRVPQIPFVMHEPQTVTEATEIISNVDMVLAERMHALVLSSILGKPFYGLAHDVKVKDLVNYLGTAHYSVNINLPFDPGQLSDGIQHILQKREQFRDYILERSASLREELGRYFSELRGRALQR